MRRARALIPALTLLLAACASGPSPEEAGAQFLARQSAAAVSARKEGELAHALALWRSVLTLDPENSAALSATRELQQEIQSGVAQALREGNAAYARGDSADGDRWMLHALALQPAQGQALAALRSSRSAASHALQGDEKKPEYASLQQQQQQQQKAREPLTEDRAADELLAELRHFYEAGDYEQLVESADSNGAGSHEELRPLLHAAHVELARRAAANGRPEQQLAHLDQAMAAAGEESSALSRQRADLAGRLSEAYYKRGVALLNSDLESALAALEKSLRLDPSNINAREKLDQAQTLSRNLELIRSR